MNIISIFGKNLLSVKYPGEKKDEFARLFELWQDAEELEEFFNDYVDDRNTYIITGGAIKLTQKMQERNHTDIELKKIEKCRNYLLDLGIVDKDGVIEEMES